MIMTIRDERPDDAPAIAELTTAAFLTAAHSAGTEAAIVDGLRAAAALTLSLVAEEDGVLVGHAAFSPVVLGGREGRWYGLGPLSVLPARQRSGIGSSLVGAGLDRLRGLGAAGAVLVGDPAFYGRLGFHAAEGLVCEGVPDRFVLARAFGDEPARGAIGFHPAFFVAS